jgi:hypothetical protein
MNDKYQTVVKANKFLTASLHFYLTLRCESNYQWEYCLETTSSNRGEREKVELKFFGKDWLASCLAYGEKLMWLIRHTH